MIIDKFENLRFYTHLLNNLEEGLDAIQAQMTHLEPGRYDFEGGYFMVQSGETKPMDEGYFEAHKRYVDVQIVVKGSEEIAWGECSDLQEIIPYDEAKDALFLTGALNQQMCIEQGMCYVAFPHDGHRPVRHTKQKQTFTKIVLKLPVTK
ncbi:MAG: biofilm protein TabA [Clostridiales bacterium]|jgi:YhcH/YjgK/YiaL family protein|nr:biofilm protein TabA [Clostridiales bacterium]